MAAKEIEIAAAAGRLAESETALQMTRDDAAALRLQVGEREAELAEALHVSLALSAASRSGVPVPGTATALMHASAKDSICSEAY